ncbi:transient receptor potential channel pyrexia isoform X1 [Diabrotica virgifera virgifera]|uniref:Transient receptor potential channel pyrexia isoform X1 n=2 Tax=Diabrotica virgifera virgifera TaxID=50390 RepID=A0A6P7F766_DIAVI|nr:transient receptor potential channel pyrexia isoform X1 [Diabrotica virgifera virgifera]
MWTFRKKTKSLEATRQKRKESYEMVSASENHTFYGMDNYGLQDSSCNSKRLGRSVSVNVDATNLHLYRTPTSNTILRWKKVIDDSENIFEEELPSDDFEYMECGPSPPADHTPHIYESFEEFSTSADLTVQICHDTIKTNLLEHMKVSSGRHQLLDDIESKKIQKDNLQDHFKGASKVEINTAFLWAAFMKRHDLLDGFLNLGADLHYFEPSQGLSAIHLTSFSGCVQGTKFLIAKSCDVNSLYKCYSPLHCAAFGDSPETALILLNNDANVQTLTNSPHSSHESVLHCAVRANAIACVKLFTQEGADVAQSEISGFSPVHLAADLGHPQCLKILLEPKKFKVNTKTKDKEQTPLHLAAESGYVDCIEILLDNGADANIRNHRQQSPLHLAARAQAYDCVEMLLRKGNSNPNMGDCDKRTPLHCAVGKAARSYDIIEILVNYGADINTKDQYGYAPLHIAALNELSQCVEVLVYHGADVTAKSKFGMTALGIITRKTPASLAMITQKLDSAITLHHHPESSNREVELRLDFRGILQYCHPREISFLNTFVDEGQKEILLHPLCSAFLYLKWEKIRKYYIARMLFCFIFVLSLSLYVLTALAHNCYNHGKNMNDTQPQNVIELCEKKSMMGHMLRNNPFVIEMQWFVLVGITGCEILRKLYGLAGYPSVRQYLSHPENIIEWTVIASVFVISFIYTGRTYTWQNHVGAFAVLFGWTNLMLMVGQLPVFGSYVAMYTRVQGEFAKLLLAYSCLLIGFTISFCVMFPDSSTFANPFIGLITVMVMMTGELSLDLLVDDDPEDPPFLLEVSAQVTYILFLLFVTVILMNLLVGIAVHDIQGLQKTAGLSKLVRQTKLISYMELALFNGYLPQYLLNLLHWTALVSPKAYRVVLNVKPLNPREKRLPKDILKAAHDIAKQRKNYGHTISSRASEMAYSKKVVNNNLDQNSEIMDCNTALPLLHSKIEKNSEQVEHLSKEIRELKSVIESNQRLVEQLLNTILQNRKNSKC